MSTFSDAELLRMIADGLLGSGFHAHREQILKLAAELAASRTCETCGRPKYCRCDVCEARPK